MGRYWVCWYCLPPVSLAGLSGSSGEEVVPGELSRDDQDDQQQQRAQQLAAEPFQPARRCDLGAGRGQVLLAGRREVRLRARCDRWLGGRRYRGRVLLLWRELRRLLGGQFAAGLPGLRQPGRTRLGSRLALCLGEAQVLLELLELLELAQLLGVELLRLVPTARGLRVLVLTRFLLDHVTHDACSATDRRRPARGKLHLAR